MPALFSLLDFEGRRIAACVNGSLCVKPAGDAADLTLVMAALGADGGGAILLEAAAGRIRLGPNAAVRCLAGIWIDEIRGGAMILRTERTGPFLRLLQGVVKADADTAADASLFRLEPWPDDEAPVGRLAAIPRGLDFNEDGLRAIFSGGDADMLPVLEALLPVVAIETIRAAWAGAPRLPSRDVFHGLVRMQSSTRTGGFPGYTADCLKPLIEEHGWSIGEGTYGLPKLLEVGRGKLTIGRYCSMAEPRIVLGNHKLKSVSSYPFVDLWPDWPGTSVSMTDHTARDVVIGHDVWIGVDTIILPGAVIGSGAVIGAGCAIRGVVPPYAICIGDPGTVAAYRFDEKTIERLLRLCWWDWPVARIDRYLALLLAPDIDAFLDEAEAENAAMSASASS